LRKLGVGVIGLGSAGLLHAESYNAIRDKARVVALCDKDKGCVELNAPIYG